MAPSQGVNSISIFWSSQNLPRSNTDHVYISALPQTHFSWAILTFKAIWMERKRGIVSFFLHHHNASKVISNISLPSLKKKTGKKTPAAVLAFPLCLWVSGTTKMGRNQLYWRHAYLTLLLSLNLKWICCKINTVLNSHRTVRNKNKSKTLTQAHSILHLKQGKAKTLF